MAKKYLRASPGALQRVYGYCRVSPDAQRESGISLDEQRRRIEARALENGWTLERVFVDAAVSGAVPLAKRPEGSQLLDAVRPGDVVKMDRCFRSALDAMQTIQSFRNRGISLWLLDLGGDRERQRDQ